MRRLTRLLLAALVVLCGTMLCLGVGPALADDGPSGSTTPPSRPGDPFNGATLPPGDLYVITPGSGGTALGDPADPDDVQSLIDANGDGAPDTATGTPGPGSTTTPSATGTAGPGADPDDPDDPEQVEGTAADDEAEDASGPAWWTYLVVAAALAALVVAGWRVRRARTARSVAGSVAGSGEGSADVPEAAPGDQSGA